MTYQDILGMIGALLGISGVVILLYNDYWVISAILIITAIILVIFHPKIISKIRRLFKILLHKLRSSKGPTEIDMEEFVNEYFDNGERPDGK